MFQGSHTLRYYIIITVTIKSDHNLVDFQVTSELTFISSYVENSETK